MDPLPPNTNRTTEDSSASAQGEQAEASDRTRAETERSERPPDAPREAPRKAPDTGEAQGKAEVDSDPPQKQGLEEQKSIWNKMPVLVVLRALWRMLDRRGRVTFSALVFFLCVSGTLEMTGMIVLFGYVSGLEANPESGLRNGPMAAALRMLHPEPLSQTAFVFLGGAAVLGFMLFKAGMATSSRFLLNRFLMKLNQRVSSQLYRGYLLAPYERFSELGAQAPSRKIGKIFNLYSNVFGAMTRLIADSSIVITVVGLLFFLDYRLTMLALGIFGTVGIGVYRLLQRGVGAMSERENEASKSKSRYLKEGMQGVVEVRLRGARRYFGNAYVAALGRSAVLQRRKEALARLPKTANEVALGLLIVGAVVYVTLDGQVVKEALPKLSVFGFAGIRMNGVVTRLNVAAQALKTKLPAFQRSTNFIASIIPQAVGLPGAPLEGYTSQERKLPPGVDGRLHEELSLRNVHFCYPRSEKEVIQDVSFQVKKGAFVSICGPSGSGKTTLLLLIMGMLRPTRGEVVCDGWSVHNHIQRWHRNIGYVGQSMYLVSRSVRENVAFGIEADRIDDEKVWHALRLASAEDFVKGLPDQLYEQLRDGGANLSGGQRQRIVIARALYEDPDILVLDEATAALDNVTEQDIGRAIATLSGKKTIVCVAHRLSTIRESDCIHLLVNGHVEASGTYDELLTHSPRFARMAKAGDSRQRKKKGR